MRPRSQRRMAETEPCHVLGWRNQCRGIRTDWKPLAGAGVVYIDGQMPMPQAYKAMQGHWRRTFARVGVQGTNSIAARRMGQQILRIG